MIPIKINGKKYQIKSISELTTSDFIELSKIEDLTFVKYIAFQTGLSLEEAFYCVTSNAIEKGIGIMPDVTVLKFCKRFDKKKLIETVGQRHQLETCNKTGLELLVYALAVAQAKSNNSDDVDHLYRLYMQQPFHEVLPSGFFFFKKYRFGRQSVMSFLKELPHLISMLRKRKVRVLKG